MRWYVIAWATPIALPIALVLTYVAAPDFYLRWILEERRREWQIVELITVISALAASILLATAAQRLFRHGPSLYPDCPGPKWTAGRGGAILIGLTAVASFFFAGEEISWGQTYLGWSTPRSYKEISGETNLHNIRDLFISVQSMGSLFILIMFIGLPILWAITPLRAKLPDDWKPAIAEWPVVFTIAVAFTWKGFKNAYGWIVTDVETSPTPFSEDFVAQINEQKEMLVAVGLLMYGLHRLAAARRVRGEGT